MTLFLDYDGCLHPNRVVQRADGGLLVSGDGALFMHADALARAMAPFDCHIVLSTSWVARFGVVPARMKLPPALRRRVTGSTFQSQRRNRWQQLTRYAQIESHARRHGLGQWIAIDDDSFGWPGAQLHQLIQPNPETGLSGSDLNRLTGWLEASRHASSGEAA